jgi:hypothetical protein
MVGRKKGEAKSEKPVRADGRKPFLAYLEPELIKNLKKAALDDERNAYEIVEEAVGDWLARRGTKRSG